MVESIENAIQLLITGLCTLICARTAYLTMKRTWILLGLASGVYFLGDLYWQLYLLFYGETPHYSHISYTSWYASYLFLILLIIELKGDKDTSISGEKSKRNERDRMKEVLFPGKEYKILWLIPVFTAGMCIFYMQWGDYISNIVSGVLMSVLMLNSAKGLILDKHRSEKSYGRKMLYISMLIFCAAEYLAWTSSCFWDGDSLLNPYFWFDSMISISFILFPIALSRCYRGLVGKDDE